MRISNREISNILNSVHSFDADADVYLFGSRTDDFKRGGDIDIAVLSTKIELREKIEIKFNFFEEFGEQKMDILVVNNEHMPFWQAIKDTAILLQAKDH